MRNCIGKFYIDRRFVHEETEQVAKVLAILGFVPLRVECFFIEDKLEYQGISSKFDELPFGMIVPEYTLEITRDEETGDVVSVEVCRCSLGLPGASPVSGFQGDAVFS